MESPAHLSMKLANISQEDSIGHGSFHRVDPAQDDTITSVKGRDLEIKSQVFSFSGNTNAHDRQPSKK